MEQYVSVTDHSRGAAGGHRLWETLEKAAGQQSGWTLFWFEFFIVLSFILFFGYMLLSDLHTRDALLVGFIGAVLGIPGVFISPVTGPSDRKPPSLSFLNIFNMPLKEFVATYSRADADNNEQVRAKAYGLLSVRAEKEREARALPNRILSIAVVTVLSLILWLAFKEPIPAAVNEVAGLIITRTRYYTHPDAAMKYIEEADSGAGV